jgi:hypothetical protein
MRNLKTVSEFADSSPFTEGQLRFWIFEAARNGMDEVGAVVRVGRRIYIDTAAFDRWIDRQNPRGEVA